MTICIFNYGEFFQTVSDKVAKNFFLLILSLGSFILKWDVNCAPVPYVCYTTSNTIFESLSAPYAVILLFILYFFVLTPPSELKVYAVECCAVCMYTKYDLRDIFVRGLIFKETYTAHGMVLAPVGLWFRYQTVTEASSTSCSHQL